MGFNPQEYNPPFFFKNGHINTFYPTLFRKAPDVNFSRERLPTPDQDFLDVDLIKKGSRHLVVLCHGLEGSSESKYILGTSDVLAQRKWDVAALNYRGCSGVMNNSLRMYHSGASGDLDVVIQRYIDEYDSLSLVGFSLGGNLVLKYLGENASSTSQKIKAAVALSVPLDLKAACLHIGKWNNTIYAKNFLISLKEKARQKDMQFPGKLKIELLNEVNSVYDFDDIFTAPIHGFKNADDYYAQSNALQYLSEIKTKSLIITALDDPFLPQECYPFDLIKNNRNLTFITPKHGGHVGFSSVGQKHYWNEVLIADYLQSQLS